MADSDYEPATSESGIRKFFRGILPQWSHSSLEGGATTPTHNEMSENGNEDNNCPSNNLRVKRKSSLIRSDDESEDSDYEENLPSCKRQRVTVSAMRRLFAKFSLSDKDSQNDITIQTQQENVSLSSPNDTSLISKDHKQMAADQKSRNNNSSDIPNLNKDVKQVTFDNNNTLDVTKTEAKCIKIRDHNNKTQKDQSDDQGNNTSEEDIGKANKRQVDVADSENEEEQEHETKVKRTRRLKRGLRLCTNITCYIEQVLYN